MSGVPSHRNMYVVTCWSCPSHKVKVNCSGQFISLRVEVLSSFVCVVVCLPAEYFKVIFTKYQIKSFERTIDQWLSKYSPHHHQTSAGSMSRFWEEKSPPLLTWAQTGRTQGSDCWLSAKVASGVNQLTNRAAAVTLSSNWLADDANPPPTSSRSQYSLFCLLIWPIPG